MEREKDTLTTSDLAGASASRERASGDDPNPVAGDDSEVVEVRPAEPVETPPPATAAKATEDEGSEPLLSPDESARFSSSWEEIQASFVDEPRRSLERADALVADVMQQLAASFSDVRTTLESQWDRGDDVSTEDLRVALTRYRSFFRRLLSA